MPWKKSNKDTNPKLTVKLEYIDLLIERLLTYTIEDVYTGKAGRNTIQTYLHVIATYIEEDKPLPAKLKKYFTDAIFKIASGENPNKALYPKRGPKAGKDKKHEIIIAMRVWFLFHYHNFNIEDALTNAASIKNKSYGTVRKIYYRYKDTISTEYNKIESEQGIDTMQYDGDALLVL